MQSAYAEFSLITLHYVEYENKFSIDKEKKHLFIKTLQIM